jgi:hypothetical protein
MNWTEEEHRARHVLLHSMLDELLTDWAMHNTKAGDRQPKLYSNTPIIELMQWSHQQTVKPDLLPGERHEVGGKPRGIRA